MTEIRSLAKLENDLNTMDIKIGLLVKNRITLQVSALFSKFLSYVPFVKMAPVLTELSWFQVGQPRSGKEDRKDRKQGTGKVEMSRQVSWFDTSGSFSFSAKFICNDVVEKYDKRF